MASGDRWNNSTLRENHDFYEPLVLLKALGTRVEAISRNENVEVGASTIGQHASYHAFLDRLSYMCDYDTGGCTVSAIALETGTNGNVFWLVTAFNALPKARSHLQDILERLCSAPTLSAKMLESMEQEICTKSIIFAKAKARHYTKLLQCFVGKCKDTLREQHEHLLYDDLKRLCSLAGSTRELCTAADQFRDSPGLRSLSRRVSTAGSDSVWSLLRHYVGRLGSWHRASRTLVEYASSHASVFRSFQVKAIATPKAVHAPMVDEYTNLESALSRMYPPQEYNDLSHDVLLLQRLRRFDLDRNFREAYRDKNFKPHVHAEAWLLEYFYSHDLKFLHDEKYIGCSKPSCYCCNLYFQYHPGKFVQRPTHGNVWTNWQPPLQTDASKHTLNSNILSQMTQKFREDLKAQISPATSAQDYKKPDSTTGFNTLEYLDCDGSQIGLPQFGTG